MKRSRKGRSLGLLVLVVLAVAACGDAAEPDAAPDGGATSDVEAPAEPAPADEVPSGESEEDLPEVDTAAWDAAADLAAIQAHFDGLAAAFDGGARAGFAALGASHRPELTADEYLECLFGEGETFENLDAEGYRLRVVWSALEPDPDLFGADDVRIVDEGFRVYYGEYVEYETFDGQEDAFEFADPVAIHPDGRVVLFTCDLGDGI